VINHMVAVAVTLAIFAFLGLAYFGWGRTILPLTSASRRIPDPIMSVWLGWAFTLLILQLLHLFLPITAYIVVPILVVGLGLSVSHVVNARRGLPRRRINLIVAVLAVIVGCGVAAWVASTAMLAPTNYDSGLYHLNAIRWINTYHIIPGLGNLHGRLAFNQSFFTYVAALNFYPFFGHGRSVANSFLLLLLVAQLLPSLCAVFSEPAVLSKRHIFLCIPDLFVFPILVYLALTSNGLASPTPDLASTILQLAMFLLLVHGLAEWFDGQRDQDQRALVLAALAATAVTVKLSNLVFSMVIVGIALVYALQKPRPRVQGALCLILTVLVIIMVWGFRGFVMSGAPFYPSTIGYVPTEWAVPREKVDEERNWVFSLARQPRAHWSKTLGNWDWLGTWSREMIARRTEIAYPLALAVLFCLIAAMIGAFSFLKKRSRPRYSEWSILLPSVLGLTYWFFTAPAARFAHALFWLLSLGASLLMLSSLRLILNRRAFLLSVCVVFMAVNLRLGRDIVRRVGVLGREIGRAVVYGNEIKSISISGWHSVKPVPLALEITHSGLAVYTPDGTLDNLCWDSPLPSTPCFNPDLRLRKPGDLASGFTVASVVAWDEHDRDIGQSDKLNGDSSLPALCP
jgi:hypothetical protein